MIVSISGSIGCGKTTFLDYASSLDLSIEVEKMQHNSFLASQYAGKLEGTFLSQLFFWSVVPKTTHEEELIIAIRELYSRKDV